MTAEIINLRQARKRRARDQKEAQAAENRIRFGRTGTDRKQAELAQARSTQTLDGHLLEATAIPAGEDTPSATIGPEDGSSQSAPAPKSPSRTPQ